jgi:predicted dehydrogenase
MLAHSENPPNVYGFGHQAYYDNVVNSLSDSGHNAVDGAEGRKSLDLINAIYESVESGKEILLENSFGSNQLGLPTG